MNPFWKKRMQQGNEFLQKPKSTNLILPSTFPVTAFERSRPVKRNSHLLLSHLTVPPLEAIT
jgi:hypothetical protein